MVARVDIRQSFTNPGTDWTEGFYVFPLPTGAAVDTLELRVAERRIAGEIHEREAAKNIYRQARESGRRAGIVEQGRPNLFSLSVANIPPGETVYIHIGYFLKVEYDAAAFGIQIPMTVTPRYLPQLAIPDTPVGGGGGPIAPMPVRLGQGADEASGWMSLSIRLEAGVELDTVRGLNHEMLQTRDTGAVSLTPVDGRIRMDRDFALEWRIRPSELAQATVFTESFGEDRYALIMLIPPDYEHSRRSRPREVILVIDVSGSMAGDPLLQAKAALAVAIRRLTPDDSFNIIAFSSDARALFDSSMPATDANKRSARDGLGRLRAEGGTEMAAALELALGPASGRRLRQVVFVTDGSVTNEADLFRLIRRKLGESRLFTVGIGSAPNRHFMEKAARFGRGTHLHVARLIDVEDDMAGLLHKLERPALTDVDIDWAGSELVEMWPARVGDLYAGEPILITARSKGDGGWVNVTGLSEHGHWLRQLAIPEGRSAAGVATLWAREKLSGLSDRMVEATDPESVRDEMVAVALEHGLVSRYTSLVAVDKTPVKPEWRESRRQTVPLVTPASGAGVRIGAFPGTSTAAPALLMTAFWLLVLAALVLFFRPWSSLEWR